MHHHHLSVGSEHVASRIGRFLDRIEPPKFSAPKPLPTHRLVALGAYPPGITPPASAKLATSTARPPVRRTHSIGVRKNGNPQARGLVHAWLASVPIGAEFRAIDVARATGILPNSAAAILMRCASVEPLPPRQITPDSAVTVRFYRRRDNGENNL